MLHKPEAMITRGTTVITMPTRIFFRSSHPSAIFISLSPSRISIRPEHTQPHLGTPCARSSLRAHAAKSEMVGGGLGISFAPGSWHVAFTILIGAEI